VKHISVSLIEEARDALRSTTLELTTPTARRLTMSEVLIAALRIAQRHRAEFETELIAPAPD